MSVFLLFSHSEGWYCIEGSSTPMPSDAHIGGRCAKGEYCPSGSEYPIDCDPGYYCHREGLAEPILQCAAGESV